MIQPWEARILKDIEKAIQKSDIGINPNNDGKVIRLVFPVLTEERRKELTKAVKKYGEDSKVAIRSIRRDAIEHFKVQKKNGEMTEDDLKDAEVDVQKLTDKYIADIDKLGRFEGQGDIGGLMTGDTSLSSRRYSFCAEECPPFECHSALKKVPLECHSGRSEES